MLCIRFLRIGKKHQPCYKIVVTDKRKPPRGGRFVEEVGFWNPLTKEKILKAERIKYWMSKGAQPSDSVYNLLIKEKICEGKKIAVHKKKKEKKEETSEAPKAKTEEKKEVKENQPVTDQPKAEKKEEPQKGESKTDNKEEKTLDPVRDSKGKEKAPGEQIPKRD